MARSRTVADTAMRDVEQSVSRGTARIESAMSRVGGSIRAGLAGALAGVSIGKLTELSDSFTKIQNQLKVGGLEGAKLASTYQSLFDIAQKQGAPLEALATLYGRVSGSQKELNASSAELLSFTNATALALKVNGTSAQESSGALLQLAQALGGGKIQAEEFNSLIDGARPLLQAAAAGIKEAGGSVATLTTLVKDGKVSSEAFFRGVLAGQGTLEKLSATTKETSEQGLTRLRNALTDLVGKFVESTGASDNAAQAFTNLASGIQGIAAQVPAAVEALSKLASSFAATAQAYATTFGSLPAFADLAKRFADPKEVKRVEDLMNSTANRGVGKGREAVSGGAIEGIDKLRAAMKANQPAPKATKPTGDSIFDQVAAIDAKALTPKTISLKDFKVPGEKDKKAGGGGGGKSSAEKVSDYQREVEAIGKRTRAFDSEREAIGKSAFEVAKAEGSFKLLEAAKKANVPVTDELRTKIDGLSVAYANAKVALDTAEEKQRSFESASRQAGAVLSDGFKDAILEGEKLTVVMDRLIKSLASKGIDSVFDSLFSKTGAGTGLLGSLFGGGGLNPTGRAAGGPVKVGSAYTVGESGRETFVPTQPGRIVPARRMGGGASIVIGPTSIDARYAQPGMEAKLANMLAARDAENRRTIGQQFADWKENH
ncbi:hypothetical protein ASG40_11665 [Methylobacterium sp. Leaf399]|nr:hypothetical protein ASG40_11665 [Methylobacterium sp. Leaf399]